MSRAARVGHLMIRLLVVLAVFVLVAGILVVRAPAQLMAVALDHVSDGRLQLAAAEGRWWRGTGLLAVPDRRGTLTAFRQLAWVLAGEGGQLVLTLGEHGQRQAQLRIGLGGFRVDAAGLALPVPLLAGLSSHAAARAGWNGVLQVASDGVNCDWSGACDGQATLVWQHAAADLFPAQPLGTHRIALLGQGARWQVTVATLDGDIRINGQGSFAQDGAASFDGIIEGPPELVGRLPNILDRHARRDGDAGRVRVQFP